VGDVLKPGFRIVEIEMNPGKSLKGKISGVADTRRKNVRELVVSDKL
jgi:hypothetical protein